MTGSIIYVSSNMEDSEFERKTREDLKLKSAGLQIYSVTQKPVDLGFNLCVGEVGASGYNFCRQVLAACAASDSDYVISAESDCLYSEDYFFFEPLRLDVPYRNTNIYVQKYGKDHFCKKESSTFSQVIGRKFYIQRLTELFDDLPMWDKDMKNFPKEIGKKLFEGFEYFETLYPCISFKTGKGMRKHSNTDDTPVYNLPFWGDTKELIRRYTKE